MQTVGLYGLGAAAFFPSNLAGLLTVSGSEAHGVLGALQRMAINVGTAVDVTISGSLLGMGETAGQSFTVQGARISWAYGAITLFAAMMGVWLAHSRRRAPNAPGPSQYR